MTLTFAFPDELVDDFPGATDLPYLAYRATRFVRHLANGDPENDGLVLALLVIMAAGAEPLAEATWGSDLGPARGLVDPSVASLAMLPYAAQVVLADMPPRLTGESDAAYLLRARDAVLHPAQRLAGGVGAIKNAARPYLSGTKAVKLVFHVGDEFHFQVRVRSDEVIDLAALEAAVDDPEILPAGQKPSVVLVTVGAAWDLGEMEDVYSGASLADLESDFASLADLESNPGGL